MDSVNTSDDQIVPLLENLFENQPESFETLVHYFTLWKDPQNIELKHISALPQKLLEEIFKTITQEKKDLVTQMTIYNALGLEDLSFLRFFPHIKVLSCAECVNLKSLSGIESSEQLNIIDISGCCQLKSLLGLEKLPLKKANLKRCTSLVDVSALKDSQLKMLNISECYSIEGFDFLEEMKLLEELVAKDLPLLTNPHFITHIKKINIQGSGLDPDDEDE